MDAGHLALEALGGLALWLTLGLILARAGGRPFGDHGFDFVRAGRRLLSGAILACLALAISAGLMAFVGWDTPDCAIRPNGVRGEAASLAALSLVAVAQEGVFRGWLLTRLARRIGALAAMVITSLAFASVHLLEPGVVVGSLLNMFIFGLALAVWATRQGALWGPIGFHAAWNMGLSLMTGSAMGPARRPMLDAGVPAWLSGGAAGLEGGLLTSLVLFGVLGLETWLWRRGATSR